MTEPTGKFAFLNRKDAIAFLRLMFTELRKLTLRDGFSGVRQAMDNALKELKTVEVTAVPETIAAVPVNPKTVK